MPKILCRAVFEPRPEITCDYGADEPHVNHSGLDLDADPPAYVDWFNASYVPPVRREDAATGADLSRIAKGLLNARKS